LDHEEETGGLEEALHRFAAVTDGFREHELRLAHGRTLVDFARGDVHRALAWSEQAVALVPSSSDPFANLAALNHHAGILAFVARYDEALRAADRFIACVETSGIDFALSHGLLAKVRALIGLRRFADARDVLGRMMTRLQSEANPDPWAVIYARMSQARLQISLGDLDRARDHLALEPDSRATTCLRAEHEALRALIEAARGNPGDAMLSIKRSRRSSCIDARALAWLAATVLSLGSRRDGRSNTLRRVDRVMRSGYLDALVMACRTQPELA
jgi:tetratricopeptide (TPR) repeat protein